MKFLGAATGQTWASTAVSANSPKPENDKAQEMKAKLEQIFTEILVSENLMVLAGLGSTMCVKDAAGRPLAPTMGQLWETGTVSKKLRPESNTGPRPRATTSRFSCPTASLFAHSNRRTRSSRLLFLTLRP
jgi:hypothetical protein